MRRRSDRGDGDGCFPALIFIVLFLGLFALGDLVNHLAQISNELHRIADAVCVYAPPAEPVVEVKEDADGED